MMLRSRLSAVYFIFYLTCNSAKIYEPCTLYNELIQQYGQTENFAAQLVVLSEQTGYNTAYSSDNDEFTNSEKLVGIFGLNSEDVCSITQNGGFCKSNCRNFVDEDIFDDISCVRKVINRSGLDKQPTLFDERWLHRCAQCHGCQMRKTVECSESSFLLYNNEKDITESSFQHIALLGYKTSNPSKMTFQCAGSLITENTIVTTAHCTHNHENKAIDLVYLGDLKQYEVDINNQNSQLFEIDSIIRHPNYRPGYNDIALIKLKTKAKLNTFVMYACLWMSRDTLPQKLTELNLQDDNQEFLGVVSQYDLKLGCCNMFAFIVGTKTTNFSNYVDWIRQHCPELPKSHIECASQSKDIDDIVYGSNSSLNEIGHIQGNVFNTGITDVHVIGVAISDKYVLTSAQMLNKLTKPDRVQLGRTYFIDQITYHPRFSSQKPSKDDTALIKLRERIETKSFEPFCISSNPSDTGGDLQVEAMLYDNSVQLLHYQDNGSNLTVCRKLYSNEFNFGNINPNNILCFNTFTYHVPGSCSIAVGSPIFTELHEMNFKNLKGFVLYNKDCGPIIATKMSAYAEWINQVVFV